MNTKKLPPLRPEMFDESMHQVIRWHLLLIDVNEYTFDGTDQNGTGLNMLWGEICNGDYAAARRLLDRLLAWREFYRAGADR